MVGYKICPKCGKKQFYFRVAFGSWRCYACGLEQKQEGYRSGEVIDLNNWWANLNTDQKIHLKELWEAL